MNVGNVQAVRSDINEMLSKIKELSNRSKIMSEQKNTQTATAPSFDNVMNVAKEAISSVSHAQAETEKLKEAYIAGDPNVSMSKVIVASEKSKLAFEGLIAVRNKILESYKDIMNMSI